VEKQPARPLHGCVRAVVADDSGEFLRSFQEFISTIDAVKVVGTGKNGLEAIRLAEELKPDLVILDLEMPGMDGLQAAISLREAHAEARIIIVSAHDRAVWQQLSMAAGADAFVTKPQLARRLPELIEKFFASDKIGMA
jgi:DNA-binding NarL/FixJ family response regulator